MDTGTLQRPACGRMTQDVALALIAPFLRERQDKLEEAQRLLEKEGAVVILRSER